MAVNMAGGPPRKNPAPAATYTMDDPTRAKSRLGRMIARLDPQSKRLLLSAAVGYLLCIWQAFCVSPPWPELARARGPNASDMAVSALNPSLARKAVWDMFLGEPLIPGEVRASIDWQSVRQPVALASVSPDVPEGWARRAETTLWGKSKAVLRPTPTYTMACFIPQQPPGARPAHTPTPGTLAAKFESGADGAASVGHTPSAGTSYGTFQIAAGTPTFGNFLRYLKDRAPDLHARLSGRGPADTGSTGGSVPAEWRRIAAENPKRFERLQYEFIQATHYRPAVAEIYSRSGVDVSALSPASREVLWSAAVQHGPGGAADIFVASVTAIKGRIVEERRVVHFEKALIEEVYKRRLSCWGNSPLVGRGAMLSRYGREKTQALTLLDRHYSGT